MDEMTGCNLNSSALLFHSIAHPFLPPTDPSTLLFHLIAQPFPPPTDPSTLLCHSNSHPFPPPAEFGIPPFDYFNLPHPFKVKRNPEDDRLIDILGTLVPIFNHLEPIIINHAVLTPPPQGEKVLHTKKPPGCKTVFVGNLPKNITKEIVTDAFKICGSISVVSMSKKNYCRITFVNTESADQALFLSQFRIRIDDSEDPASNDILYVCYQISKEDMRDYEALVRAKLQEKYCTMMASQFSGVTIN